MYDNHPTSSGFCKSKSDLDLWNVESAAFRLLTTQAFRAYQNERMWCYEGWKTSDGVPNEEGLPYKFGEQNDSFHEFHCVFADKLLYFAFFSYRKATLLSMRFLCWMLFNSYS